MKMMKSSNTYLKQLNNQATTTSIYGKNYTYQFTTGSDLQNASKYLLKQIKKQNRKNL